MVFPPVLGAACHLLPSLPLEHPAWLAVSAQHSPAVLPCRCPEVLLKVTFVLCKLRFPRMCWVFHFFTLTNTFLGDSVIWLEQQQQQSFFLFFFFFLTTKFLKNPSLRWPKVNLIVIYLVTSFINSKHSSFHICFEAFLNIQNNFNHRKSIYKKVVAASSCWKVVIFLLPGVRCQHGRRQFVVLPQ